MSERTRILIVGGVAGGASAAARLRRLSEQAEIVMFERGEHISFANCGLPYHIGGAIVDRQRLLVQTPESMLQRYNVQVRVRTEVIRIDRQTRQLAIRDVATGRQTLEPYDYLVLSPGAEPVRPPIPGIDHGRVFTLRSMRDMDAIKQVLDDANPHRAVIVGGGYIGLEMAEALRQRGLDVTLVELAPQVFNVLDGEMAEPIHQHMRAKGVDLRLGTSVSSIADDAGTPVARLSTGEFIPCDMILVAVGVRPETKLARESGLTLGPSGGIAVDEHMRTSDERIYAVGDAVEITDFVSGKPALVPLAGPANRQGRIAADNIMGRPTPYRCTQGTAICKVFDLAVAMTGLSEKALKRVGLPYEKVYVHPANHAGYYPGSRAMSLKLLFDPQSGRVLGAQAVGYEGVDKRIDVLAVAIRAGMTVFDLEDLELCYAPPYGSAKDPVNYAGFVAANAIRGDVKLFHTPEAVSPSAGQLLLDVRTPTEVQAGTIDGAVNIPVDELRRRMSELPRDKELLVFCQVGLRGYLACRILSQNGFACRNLSGGYKTYQYASSSSVSAAGILPASAEGVPPSSSSFSSSTEQQQQQDQPQQRQDEGKMPSALAGETPTSRTTQTSAVAIEVDARGLACPGPIMRLKTELAKLRDGQTLRILASDAGFPADVAAWCNSVGHELIQVGPKNEHFEAIIARRDRATSQQQKLQQPQQQRQDEGKMPSALAGGTPTSRTTAGDKTIVVFSGDFDKVTAAFVIANGAVAMGSKVTMFFTFWGLNALRRRQGAAVEKNIVERMFGWMMPRGAGRLKLSQMNMLGAGLAMIKGIMRKKNVPSLEQFIASAVAGGVKLIACTMSMDLMGIRPQELIDGVEYGGVAAYLGAAERGNVNLFI